MSLPSMIDAVRRRPGMFIVPVTFNGVVALLGGYDIALSGGFLVGFREWLIVRLGYGNNLAWFGLALEILRRDGNSDDEGKCIEGLFVLLEEFVDVRAAHGGLRRIFMQYERWLHQQDWYTPKSPDWLEPVPSVKPVRSGKRRRSS